MNLVHRYLVRIVPEKGTIFEVPVYADSEREAMVTVRNLLEHRNGTEKFAIDLVRHERWADPERGLLRKSNYGILERNFARTGDGNTWKPMKKQIAGQRR